MTPHTPGPWGIVTAAKYGADHDHPAVIKDEGDGIPWCVIAARVTGPDLHQARANARLIAAAPEMLALIQYVATSKCKHPDDSQACHFCAARALLARIEGKE